MKKIVLILFSIGFILSRLYHLLAMPPFLDETIYLRWLTIIKSSRDWLLPLKEFGWEPLNIWLSTLLSYLVKDNLLSLRLTAAFFGGLSLLVAYKLTKTLFNHQAAIFISLILIFSPLILIHDRLGLRGDSAVTFVSFLSLYGLSLRLIKAKPKAVYWVSLAVILGFLIKSTAFILAPIALLSYLCFRPKLTRHDFLAAILMLLPLIFYFFTGTLNNVLNKQTVFLLPLDQFASQFKANLTQAGLWTYQYLSWPVLLTLFLGLIVSFKTFKPAWVLIILNTLPPLLFILISAKIFFPRYILSLTALSLLFAAVATAWLYQHLPQLFRLGLIIIFIPNLILSFQVIKDMTSAQLPEIERWQYVTGWPSGYGLKELVNYLKIDTPSVLVTETDDLIKTGVAYYWPDHPFTITQTATKSAYFVVNINNQLPEGIEGELIKDFPRPENKSSIKLFKVYSSL